MTGYIACYAGEGDHISDHPDAVIRDTAAEAEGDRADNGQSVRWVAADGYLYIEPPQEA